MNEKAFLLWRALRQSRKVYGKGERTNGKEEEYLEEVLHSTPTRGTSHWLWVQKKAFERREETLGCSHYYEGRKRLYHPAFRKRGSPLM